MTDFDPTALLGSLAIAGVVAAVLYVYMAVILMVLARKTGTPNGWLAWIPIANVVLLCHIGRRSGWLALLLLIPLVNILVAVWLWMCVAEARGKPSWTGILMIVPVVSLFVPIYLAADNGAAAAPAGGGPRPAPAAGGPRVCPGCGTRAEPSEAFCGECGQPLPTPVAAAGARIPPLAAPPPVVPAPSRTRLGLPAVLLVVLVLAGAGVWLFVGKVASYSPPKRTTPAMPQRMAGTMKEFPVDSDRNAPARPTSVVAAKAADASRRVPPKWLPPGLDGAGLARRASSLTSASYRAPQGPPVSVHVLESDQAQQIVSDIAAGAGPSTQTTGVQVQSPQGALYQGWRVQSPQTRVYVLDKQNDDVVIVVYASEPGAQTMADRLAANVGNGAGLYDDPEMQNSLWCLPPALPGDLALEETNTYLPADLGLSLDNAEVQQALSQVRQLIPERLTTARYRDTSRRDWNILLGDYRGGAQAWGAWQLVRWFARLGNMEPAPVGATDGVTADTGDGRLVLFRKGPFVAVIGGPKGAALERLLELARALQI